MFKYFIRRALRKKTIYISLLIGAVLSLLYIYSNVLPYTDYEYHQSPYTLWIGCFTSSIFAELFFMLIPILAAITMSDTFLNDKKIVYMNVILSKGKKRSYFFNLYLVNFIIGGLCFALPVLINIYCCFLLLPDLSVDIITQEATVVTLYGNDTILPALYYAHPLVHMFLYVGIGFITAGMFASMALALSFYLKNKFFTWISAFAVNYVYMAVAVAVVPDGTSRFLPENYMRQVGGAGDPVIMTVVLLVGLIAAIIIYVWSVKKRVIH